ncbi:hypothetical protein [Sinimarinibacterium flocculans]|uniref:hypothetical protein n=1 Tax=Sinimarinibacterium flocculans TaxID=985250 RepID=UPI002491E50C|nr:hypothetical protein [Sinimarinibacterium flocculans]
MRGSSLSKGEAQDCIVRIAAKFERENPEYGAETVLALVKERLSGYPADLIEATLDPEVRAAVESSPTLAAV